MALILAPQLPYYLLLGQSNNYSYISLLIIAIVEQLQSSQQKKWKTIKVILCSTKKTRICRIHCEAWHTKQTRKAKLAEIPNIYKAVMNVDILQLLVYLV